MTTKRGSGLRPGPLRRRLSFLAVLVGAVTLMVPTLAGASEAGRVTSGSGALATQGSSNITITQTTSSNQGWFCLPGALILQRSIHNTPEYFELVVKATSKPCSPIKATAAIYGMPGNGVAWPQQLIEKKDFTISKAGKTTIRFTKTCDPVQFDVLTGATPQVISPTGPWHGPLLFPFDMETSRQHWGCVDGTTTTTSPCENYAARQLATSPPVVTPGDDITVSGLGTPGSTLLVWIIATDPSDPDVGAVAATITVPASGQWSTDFTIPIHGPIGRWSANAQASDCEAVASVDFDVTAGNGNGPSVNDPDGDNGSGEPLTPADADQGSGEPGTNGSNTSPAGVQDDGSGNGSGDGSQVLSDALELDLPSEAVLSSSATNTSTGADQEKAGSGNVVEAALAWTGSNVRLPIVVGVALLVGGLLILLRSRRAAETV